MHPEEVKIESETLNKWQTYLLSSEVGDTRGVVGVTDPGRKKVSSPSPRSEVSVESAGRSIGLVGALVLARLGLPLTKCCNC